MSAPGALAPAAGAKVPFMSLIDNEDPDDLFELIDELAVGKPVCKSIFGWMNVRVRCVERLWLAVSGLR